MRKSKKKRIYSRGSFRHAFSHRRKCMFCGKITTRQSGLLGHQICSKCGIKYK